MDHPQQIGSYKIESRIAQTNLSEVYIASDASGRRVCLKRLLPSLAAPGSPLRLSFAREAALLAEVAHPHVVRVLDMGEAEEAPFVCLELIQGEPLNKVIQQETLSIISAVDLLHQICDGLARIHSKGIIHADLKPHNVLAEKSNGLTTLKIADFGLACDVADDSTIGVSGTPHYMAPEQTRLVDWPITPRSDLYAMGVIAFELTTGKLPFDSEDVAALLKAQTTSPPPRPSDLRPEIPPLLEKIILKLLEKNPAQRYRDSQSLKVDLERLSESLRSGEVNPEFPLDTSVDLAAQLDQVFVGRTEELSVLESAYDRSRQKNTQAVFVGGVAGVGKSVLLREFLNRSVTRGARFATGKAYPFARSLPYFVLAETLTDFLRRVKRLPDEEKNRIVGDLRKAVGDLAGELVKIAPAYAEIFPDAKEVVYLGDGRDRLRFLQLMIKVFEALASQGAPLVLLMDDLQWADVGTLQVLQNTIEIARDCPILVLASYRSEEVFQGDSLHTTLQSVTRKQGFNQIDLRPFNADQTQLMIAESMRQPQTAIPEELVKRVHDRTEGNPLFIAEVLKSLISTQILKIVNGSIAVALDRLETAQLPGSIIDFVLRRIDNLDEITRALLGSAALIGKGFSIEFLTKISQSTPEVCFRSVQFAVSQNLLQPPSNGTYRFHHDRVREACLGLLPVDERKQHHWRIVDYLEGVYGAQTEPEADLVFELAEHATAADDTHRGWKYSRQAGELAEARYANDQALTFFRQAATHAIKHVPSLPAKERREVEDRMARVLDLLGRYQESAEVHQRLLTEELTQTERADVLAKLAITQHKAGQHHEAESNFTQALSMLGVHVRHSRLGLYWAKARFAIGLFGLRISASRKQNSTTQRVVDILFYMWLLLLNSDAKRAPFVANELMATAVKLGVSKELAIAHGTMLITLMQHPKSPWNAALRHGLRAVEVAKQLNLPLIAAKNAQYTSHILVVSARFREGLSFMQNTREAFTSLGNMWELANVHIFSYLANVALGRLDDAIVHAHALVELGERIGAMATVANGHQKVAQVLFYRGEVAKAETHISKSLSIAEERKLNLERFQGYKILAEARLRQERHSDARAQYAAAIRLMETPGISFLPTYIWDTHFGYAESVLKDSDYLAQIGGMDAKEVRALVPLIKRGIAKEKYLRRHLAHGFRAWALYEARSGHFKASKRYFTKAMTVLNQQERPIDLAFTQLDAAFALGQQYAEQSVQWLRQAHAAFEAQRMKPMAKHAEDLLARLGAPIAQQVQQDDKSGETLRKLIEISQMLMESRNPDKLLERIVEVSMSLVGAERGFIFIRERDGDPLVMRVGMTADGTMLTQEQAQISLGVVKRVDDSGQGVAVSDIGQDATLREHRSITVLQLRSILSAPLIYSSNKIGVLYLDSQMTRAMFGKRELDVIQSLAGQAAVAISNALQFHTIEVMNQELDAKVLERTRQLEMANVQLKATIDEVRNTTLRLAEAKREALEKELHVARDIQLAMVPPPRHSFEVDAANFVGLLHPASFCGGDVWTFSENGDKLLLFIGDVTGHGVASAMITTVAKSCLDTIRIEHEEPVPLEKLMATLNDVIALSGKGEFMMTAFAVEIDPTAKSMRYAVAGHNPQYLVSGVGEGAKVAALFAASQRLGDGRGNSFTVQQRTYTPGDRLVMFTDGIVEGKGPEGKDYGERRLRRLIQKFESQSSRELLDTIEKDAYGYFGPIPQEDDLTLVVATLR